MKPRKIISLAVSAVLVALFFSSCQKDNTVLRIAMARYDGSGKVTMDGLVSYWSEGDNLVVNYGSVPIATNGHTVSVSVPTSAMYKAVYPAE